jgi:LCP family protein required for cell wall assembly
VAVRSWLRSPLGAASLSALVPGGGHLAQGRRRTGWTFVGITLLVLLPAVVVALAVLGGSGARLAVTLSRPFFEHPWLILVLLAVDALLLVFRVGVVVDAYQYGLSADRRHRRGARLAAGVLVVALLTVFVAVPHGWAARRGLALYDLLTYDFTADPGFGSEPTTTPPATLPPATTVPDTTTTRPAATTTVPGGSTTVPQSTTTVPVTTTTIAPTTTTTTVPTILDTSDRLTVALLGGDAGLGRSGIRTDTIIVVSVDTVTGNAAMFSIPRNWGNTPIPADHPAHDAWGCGCYPEIANTIYPAGLARPELFPGGPNSGINAVKTVVGEILGIPIDYVALVALDGFVDLIDAVGGVDITVVKPVYDPEQWQPDGTYIDIDLPPGDYHWDGRMALAYARARSQDSDYSRMDRQRCLLEAVASELDTFTLLARLPLITEVVKASLVTDIPFADIPDLFDLADRVDTDRVISLRFVPSAPDLAGTGLSYIAGVNAAGYSIPNVPLIRERVRIAIEEPLADAIVSLNAPSLDAACSVP